MAARLARNLLLVNRRGFGPSSYALPRVANASALAGLAACRSAWKPWTGRVTQANVARYSHTDSSSSTTPNSSIIDATPSKISSVTEKHWKRQDLRILAPLIEPQAVLHFLEFISSGILPNGKKTGSALPHPDEVPLFMAPSSQWAPAPFNKDSVSTVEKAMSRIANPEDSSGLCQIGQNIHFIKTRLWGGLVPVPASRWREKDLNNPDHFTIAHEYLSSVLAVFEYLNIPQVRTNMRDTFNKISSDFGEIQDALNARRAAQGSLPPELNLTALWEQYIRAVYEVMTSSAHSWVLARVAELRERALDDFIAIPAEDAEVPGNPELEKFTVRWHDLMSVIAVADFSIWLSMDGYNGYNPPSDIIAGLHNPDLKNKYIDYGLEELLFDRLKKCIKAQNEAALVQGPSATQSDPARRERFSLSTEVQDELREKIRGRDPPAQPPVQPWIQQLLQAQDVISSMPPSERPDYSFGLAIYRAADKLSDEQWETLKRKLEADLSAWGDDVQRADELKPLFKLHWFDCKELGFDTANPITEARRHFQQIRSSDESNINIEPSVFLLVDPFCVGSYIDGNYHNSFTKDKGMLPGDFQGYVLAVDANFDDSAATNESETADHKDNETPQVEALTYPGHMRILGNLVWSDLYPMVMLESLPLDAFWVHAREHPEKVYTGPTVPSQVVQWKERNVLKNHMMDSFLDFLKQKDPKAAGKVKELRKQGIL